MNNILEVRNLTSGYGRSNIIRDLSFSMKENIGIFGHSFGGTKSLYSGFYNSSIKSCF